MCGGHQHTGSEHRRRRPTILAWMAVLLVGLLAPLGAATPASAAEIEFSSVTTYLVRPDDGVVEVTVEVTADQSEAYGPGYEMLVPTDARNLEVTGGTSTRTRLDEWFDLVTVLYPDNGLARTEMNTAVRYTLHDGASPDGWATIVNRAVASFLVFDGVGADNGEIVVILPDGFGPDTGPGDEMTRREVGNAVHYEASFRDGDFANYLSVSHSSRFVSTKVDLGDFSIEVKAWPTDPEWANEVAVTVRETVPTLVATVGLDWAVGDDLVIQQSQAPYLAGYGGWYDPTTRVIEIGENWDDHLLLHEISHTWFNDGMFDERWITEGLADAYTTLTLEAMGHEALRPMPELLELGQLVPLSEWGQAHWQPGLDEYWAYEASWAVMLGIVDEAGSEAMENAMRVAQEGVVAYRPSPADIGDVIEVGRVERDWKYLFDLVGNAAHESRPSADLAPLLLTYVVPAEEGADWSAVFEERSETRSRYQELDEADGDWSTPIGIRLYMGAWDFEAARAMIGDANVSLSTIADTVERFEASGIPVPSGVEEAYEEAELGLGAVDHTLLAAEQAVTNAAEGEARLDEPRSFTTRIGLMWGNDVDGLRQPLRDAAARGDGIEADRLATEISSGLREAESDGLVRLMLLAMVLVLPVVVIVGLRLQGDDEEDRSPSPPVERPESRTTGLPDLALYGHQPETPQSTAAQPVPQQPTAPTPTWAPPETAPVDDASPEQLAQAQARARGRITTSY